MLMGILTWLGNLLGGPFAKAAVDAYKAKLTSDNDKDRMAADLVARELALEGKIAEVNSNILIAEQGHWMTRWVRPVGAVPFVAFTWKVIIYDKLLGWGSTDPLDANMWSLMMIVFGAYYGGRSIEKAVGIWAMARNRK